MKLTIPDDYPEHVRAALGELSSALTEHHCERWLSALVVYGSVARREARAGSDLNLAVVLTGEDVAQALGAMRAPMRAAFRVARLEPFVLLRAEISRLSDVFPAKLLDIQAHHDCIFGDDPFRALEVAWPDLRFRVEQELRNQLIRMRRFYLFRGDDAQQLGVQLDQAIASISVELQALLRLTEGGTASPRIVDVMRAASALLDLDPALTDRLVKHRARAAERSVVQEQALYHELMTLVARAVEYVDRLLPPETSAR